MKIFYDTTRDLLVVENTRAAWPPLSLTAVQDASGLSVLIAGTTTRIAGPLQPTDIQRIDGTWFNDVPSAFAYLVNTFSQQHAAPALVFPQDQPAVTWLVAHNLNAFPTVTTTDSTGEVIAGTVRYIDLNTLTIDFTYPIAGVTYID